MKFIDKALNQPAGNLLVRNFLRSQWNNLNNSYYQINYSTYPNHSFRLHLRDSLRNLLLGEQQQMCCYCMRIIDVTSTTLEHIVPKSTSTIVDLNQYCHVPIIRDNVCLQSVFDSSAIELDTPPFPLEIAYENLTASCNGIFPSGASYNTCNHKRGSILIEPLFYISTIETDIIYKKAGILFSSNSAYDTSINTLNLNYDSLERIRQVWYHISVEDIADIENATTEALRNIILTINLINLPSARRIQLIADFKTDTFWNILLQYKWFYSYYRTTYPIAARQD